MSVLTGARSLGLAATLGALTLAGTSVDAAPINEVDYFSLTVGQTIDFESIAGGAAPGTNYDEVLNFGGVQIGERFAGQTLSFSGNSDVLSDNPVGPLSVVAGAPNQNLVVATSPAEHRDRWNRKRREPWLGKGPPSTWARPDRTGAPVAADPASAWPPADGDRN